MHFRKDNTLQIQNPKGPLGPCTWVPVLGPGPARPWAVAIRDFITKCKQLGRKLNGEFAELRSSHEHNFGYARSHSCGCMRSHKVRASAFRSHESCETTPTLKIITPVYTGQRRHTNTYTYNIKYVPKAYISGKTHVSQSPTQDLGPALAYLIGVRGSPERDISSLGAMGQGPGTFPELFTYRRVRLLVVSVFCRDFMQTFLYV